MAWQIPRLYPAVLFLVGLGGCAHLPYEEPAPEGEPRPPLELPATERGNVEASLKNVPVLPTGEAALSGDLPKLPPYRALTAKQAQCLAVNNSSLSRMLAQEREALAPPPPLCPVLPARPDRRGDLQREMLDVLSRESENRTAGAALELYYRLAEAEGKADLLNESRTHLRDALERTSSMLAQKLRPPVEFEVWARQALTVQSDRTRAQYTIAQLNSELQRLLGLDPDGKTWRLWNPEAYSLVSDPIDLDAAIKVGLENRPELISIRLVLDNLDADTLPVARAVLQSVNPLLGQQPSRRPLVLLLSLLGCGQDSAVEADVRRRQLLEHLRAREEAVVEEIRLASAERRTRTKMVTLAQARVKSWENKVKELLERQSRGLANFAEVIGARLDGLKARGELIEEVMAWHIAGAKLKQAQGVLPLECEADSTAAPELCPATVTIPELGERRESPALWHTRKR